MGGYGSGYKWSSKTTVESCLVLSAASLMRQDHIQPDRYWAGKLTWTNTYTGEKISSIGFESSTSDDRGSVRLQFTNTNTGVKTDDRVELTTTPLPWGGRRWWFNCPLIVNGRNCDRRVGKLYLPPGCRHFGCRHCYDLTYTSCQESHRYEAGLRDVGKSLGLSAREVSRLLSGKFAR